MRHGFASFLLALAACGDDPVRHLPDAPPPPDVAPDTPTSGVVTLTITSSGTPQQNVRVLFQNADSSLVMSTTTNASGVAMATMMAGGYVTAIDPFVTVQPGLFGAPRQADLRTFAGVKPGDNLTLIEGSVDIAPITVTMVVPTDAAISTYLLRTTCGDANITIGTGSGSGSGGPGGPVQLTACANNKADMLLEGQDGNGQTVLWLFHPDVDVVEGGVVDLTADSYTAAVDASFAYMGVPAALGSLNVTRTVALPRGRVFDSFATASLDNGMATITQKAPGMPNGSFGVTLSRFFGGNLSRHGVVDWGAASNAYMLVATNVLLADYTTEPTLDIPTHALAWTVGTGVAADLSIVNFRVGRPSNGASWNWQIVAPAQTSIVLPVLAAEGATFNPITDDSSTIFELRSAKVPGGYDAVRAHALSNVGPEALVAGATGRAVFQEFFRGKVAVRSARPLPSWAPRGR